MSNEIVNRITKTLLKDLGFIKKGELPQRIKMWYDINHDWWVYTPKKENDNYFTVYDHQHSKKIRFCYDLIIFFYDQEGDRKPFLELYCNNELPNITVSVSPTIIHLGFLNHNKSRKYATEFQINIPVSSDDIINIRHCVKEGDSKLSFEFRPECLN